MAISDYVELFKTLGSIAGIAALISAFILWRKAKWEIKHEEASTAEQFEGIAERTLKKLNAEIEKNQSLYADVMLLKKENAEFREEISELREHVGEYERGINLLITQLESNKFVPIWKPKKGIDNAKPATA